MTAADRIRARRDECAAVVDLLRREGRADSARLVETRMQAWADAMAEAREAEAAAGGRLMALADAALVAQEAALSARLAAMVAKPEPLAPPPMIEVGLDADGRLVARDMAAPAAPPAATSQPPAPDVTPPPPPHRAPDAEAPAAASQPPAADVTASTPPADAGHQVLKIWSDDRVALLRTLYAQADLTLDAIAAQLNALPGPPVRGSHAVKLKAWKLRLLRPALPAAPLADPAPGDADTLPEPMRRHGTAPHVWTPERVALLRSLYAAGVKRIAILDQVNALPGPACASVDALKTHAKKLGLTRQGADTPATFAAALPEAAPPAAIPPAVAPPAAAQPARDEADPLTWHPAEDIAEARQMMRSGKVGAKALSEYFGWSLAEAQAIAAALRDDLEAEARSRAA